MINEDMNTLMERYKKQLIEFERRSSMDVSARAEDSGSMQEQMQPVSARAQLQEDAVAASTEPETEEQDAAADAPAATDLQETERRLPAPTGPDMPQERTSFSPELSSGNAPARVTGNSPESTAKFNAYKSKFNKEGYLRVETYGSNGLSPVSNSRVVVYKPIDGVNYYIYDTMTDASGILDNLALPAPDKNLSLQPSNDGVVPYATYNVYVEHPDFVRTFLSDVPIFDGIVSVQPVEMLPAVEKNSTAARTITCEPTEL